MRGFLIPLSLFEWESIGVRVWQHHRETNLSNLSALQHSSGGSYEPPEPEVAQDERNGRTGLNKQSRIGSLKFGPGSGYSSLEKGSGPIRGQ